MITKKELDKARRGISVEARGKEALGPERAPFKREEFSAWHMHSARLIWLCRVSIPDSFF
jgi:hypothetical protein